MIRQPSQELIAPNGQSEARPEKMRCHERLHELMHRPIVDATVIFLIVVDALLVVSTLVIELRAPCSCPDATANSTVHDQSTISAPAAHGSGDMEPVLEALHLTSLAILCVFMVEVFLKMFAQREKFFHHKIQVVDAFVIVISFAVDVAVVVIKAVDESNSILDGLGLLVLLRLWRLVRIVNGAVLTTEESIGNRVAKERQLREAAENHVDTLKQSMASLQEENSFLRMRLVRYEPPHGLQHSGQASRRDHAAAAAAPQLPPYLPDSTRLPTNVLGDLTDGEYDTAVFSKASSSTTQPAAARAYISMDLDPDNLTVRSTTDSDSMTMAPSALRFAHTQTVKKSGVPMTAL